jgi:hypothetical protein
MAEAYSYEYYNVKYVRECKSNTAALRWTEEQRFQLARLGTMRIGGLKEKILTLQSKVNAESIKVDPDTDRIQKHG